MVKVSVKKREIYLCGAINIKSAQVAIRALKEFDKKANKEIFFYINSGGGNIGPVLDIYHAMHNIKSHVTTVAFKEVKSGALVVLQGGNEKYATPRCKFYFHQACAEFKKNCLYNSTQLVNIAHKLLRQDIIQLDILSYDGGNTNRISKLFDYNAVIGRTKARKLKIINGLWHKPIPKP